MTVTAICSVAGALILGILIGIILGIARFGEQPPIGTLKIRYGEPDEDPYIFLELWKEADHVTRMKTLCLQVVVEADDISETTAPNGQPLLWDL